MRTIPSIFFGLAMTSTTWAGDPPLSSVPAQRPQHVVSAPYSAPCQVSSHQLPCCRPGRVWLAPNRPIFFEDKFRYEPRIRDIRFAPMSSTLPGTGLGAPDTMSVIPSHRDGYFRMFQFR
jgi:hypothetical protein